jgi:hypothetical protein
LTEIQRETIEAMQAAGATCAVAYGIDEAIARLTEWGLLRASNRQPPFQFSPIVRAIWRNESASNQRRAKRRLVGLYRQHNAPARLAKTVQALAGGGRAHFFISPEFVG